MDPTANSSSKEFKNTFYSIKFVLKFKNANCSAPFDLPQADDLAKKKAGIMCHMCGELGHKSFQCPKNPEVQEQLSRESEEQENVKPGHDQQGRSGYGGRDNHPSTFQPYQFHPRPQFYPRRGDNNNRGERPEGDLGPRRALEDVVCYKCGYKGHYANKCNKGHLAFLSHKAGSNSSRDNNVPR